MLIYLIVCLFVYWLIRSNNFNNVIIVTFIMDNAFPIGISSLPLEVAIFTRLWEQLDTPVTWYDRVGRPSSLKHKQQERTRHQHATTIGEGEREQKTVKTEHDSRGGAQNTNNCTCIQSEDRRVRRGDWTVKIASTAPETRSVSTVRLSLSLLECLKCLMADGCCVKFYANLEGDGQCVCQQQMRITGQRLVQWE